MKKLGRAIFLVGLMLILFTVLFVACNTNSTDNNQVQNGNQQSDANNDTNGQFIVTVHPNNGNSTFKWTIASDIPSIEREGYYFDGIYLDSTFMSATSFESLKKTGIKSNLDVYVKWTSHKHEFGSWHILIKPTHISEGLRVWYCSLCDAEKYETMPKVGEHVFSLVWTIDIESTTTTDGEKSHHCTILGCTERKDITTIPKKDSDGSSTPVGHEHNMVLLEKVPATCTVVGYEINKCEECDYVKRTTLPIVSNTIDHRELLAGEKCTKCGYTSISNLRDSVLMYNTSYDTYCAEYYGTIVEKDIFEYYNQRINLAYLSDTIETIARDSFKDWISLDHIILPNTITKIEENAFYGCSLLNAVSIPDSVEEIEESAFAQCINLEKISMSQSLKHIGKNVLWGTKWFEDQPAGLLYLGNVAVAVKQGCLKVDAIKEGTRIVADDFFAGQSELSIITIPSTILHFGEKVFDGCSNLSGVFYNAINAECKDNLFENKTSLEHAVFGENVEKVPEGLFAGCTQLADVIFVGNNVTEIGASAFFKCSKLAAIIVPDSVTSIGESAFEGCNGLTSITIPDSVTSIGNSIFSGCSSLENITIPFVGEKAGVTSSDTYQYPFGYIFGTSSYTGGVATKQYYYGNSTSSTTSTTYYIPSSLKSVTVTGGNILYGAFYNCSGLTSVTIGNSVTSIGNSAFYGCNNLRDIYITDIAAWCNISGLYNLMKYGSSKRLYINNELATSITIPDGVTAIPSYAFSKCTGLTSVTIPDSVTSIGDEAFQGCTGLKTLFYAGTEEQWKTISIGSYDSSLTSATRVYNYDGVERTYSFVTDCEQSVDPVTATYLSTLPTVTKEGHHFGGWYDNAEFTGNAITAPYCSKDKTTLYAKWLTEEEWNALKDGTTFAKAYVAESGQNYDVTITTGGQIMYFVFTPTTNGSFTIQSIGSGDTYGTLYSASQSSLMTDDDGGDGNNFKITHTMTAGTTYYVAVKFYNSSTTGTFKVSF